MILTIIYDTFETSVQEHDNLSQAVSYVAMMDTVLDTPFQYDIIEGTVKYSNSRPEEV